MAKLELVSVTLLFVTLRCFGYLHHNALAQVSECLPLRTVAVQCAGPPWRQSWPAVDWTAPENNRKDGKT